MNFSIEASLLSVCQDLDDKERERSRGGFDPYSTTYQDTNTFKFDNNSLEVDSFITTRNNAHDFDFNSNHNKRPVQYMEPPRIDQRPYDVEIIKSDDEFEPQGEITLEIDKDDSHIIKNPFFKESRLYKNRFMDENKRQSKIINKDLILIDSDSNTDQLR